MFTTAEFIASGRTKDELAWAVRKGSVVRVAHGLYVDSDATVDSLTLAVARVRASGHEATGLVAATVYGLDSLEESPLALPTRRRVVAFGGGPRVVDGVVCASPLQVLVELAALLDDDGWEQALESALRKKLVTISDFENPLAELSGSRTHGVPRIRRVLARRPNGAPATESLLETLMVQLARRTEGVPEPERQVEVRDDHDAFVARLDLAWPACGAFTELDGQQHKNQPVYDAARQTSVVVATGWLPGRFTWKEVRFNPVPTSRKLVRLLNKASRRRGS